MGLSFDSSRVRPEGVGRLPSTERNGGTRCCASRRPHRPGPGRGSHAGAAARTAPHDSWRGRRLLAGNPERRARRSTAAGGLAAYPTRRSLPHLHYCASCTTVRCAAVAGRGGAAVDASQLLKGVLDVAVLAVVRDADGYGYDVVRRLRTAGLEEVGDASVYGTLRRLYQAGALTSYVVPSDEGPHRKYYAINDRGRSVLEDSTKTWRTFADTVDGLLAGTAVAA